MGVLLHQKLLYKHSELVRDSIVGMLHHLCLSDWPEVSVSPHVAVGSGSCSSVLGLV